MSDFWTKKKLAGAVTSEQPGQTSSEEDVAFLESLGLEAVGNSPLPEPELDDPEDDMTEVLSNANLRLEQGRLYQMIIEQPLFANTDADPKSIRIVEREIRRHARERMEFMLGMRHETAKEQAIVVSSPFNDLEVIALKTIAAQMSKGATKAAEPAAPKKPGITAISGTTKKTATVSVEPKPLPKNRTAPVPAKPAPVVAPTPASAVESAIADNGRLNKPIDKMTPAELLAHETESQSRHQNLKAALPPNIAPIPSPAEMENLYRSRLSSMTAAPGTAAMQLVKLLGPQ